MTKPCERALLSVSDKTGLTDFARGLSEVGVELIASGGTAQAIRDAGLPVTSVAKYTGLPSVLGGRVKTLHPAIHGGILARDSDDDRATLSEQDWRAIDVVVVNLYPFVETIGRAGVTLEEAIEQIDIGGVALLRAAAKNHARVTVVSDPADYAAVLAEIRENGNTPPETRFSLARKAFAQTAAYDAAIAGYLAGSDDDALPDTLSVTMPRALSLRYGENPHQQAALYTPPGVGPLGGDLLQGKPLSYNNLLDLDAAWTCAADFDDPAVVIVKHLGPCGVACGDEQAETFRAALSSDPVSAFGGVIATNRPFDGATAAALGDLFVEAIAAPAFTDEAREVLAARENCRLLPMGDLPPTLYNLRSVRGGMLLQTPDIDDDAEWQAVTKRQPTDAELDALRFAWRAVSHAKSNAIVLAQGRATVGIGGGLPSRVDSVKLAVAKAGEKAKGAVLASDAFFPFDDGPRTAAEAGVTAIVQPGGSVRDEEVIAAVDELGLAMCFTGVRHFRH
jgi:phosphoribosylaminoimidazolecarboxamide formyltransferase/IMP cyclohydrolase